MSSEPLRRLQKLTSPSDGSRPEDGEAGGTAGDSKVKRMFLTLGDHHRCQKCHFNTLCSFLQTFSAKLA